MPWRGRRSPRRSRRSARPSISSRTPTSPARASRACRSRSARPRSLASRRPQGPSGSSPRPRPRPWPRRPPPSASSFAWTPTVDDDMIELFFDEATERVEALAGKLVEIERRPDDGDLLRDVFRDLHTVKGSSAMVGLAPVNQLAHAAEDLVGQIRDAGRAADGPVIDALLAALDGLRDMLGQARARAPITVDPAPIVARLRNPGAPVVATPRAAASPSAVPAATAHAPDRATIRVDFDKLDRLLNLVGELVLGRDDLRHAVASLGSVATELAADRRRRAPGRERARRELAARCATGLDVARRGAVARRARAGGCRHGPRSRHRSTRRDLRRAARAGDALRMVPVARRVPQARAHRARPRRAASASARGSSWSARTPSSTSCWSRRSTSR